MNDRYLYRAKRTDNGEWVTGYLYGIWEKKYILWGMINDKPDMTDVDPSTICQCTGQPDKNGKLIFEHDIVSDEGGNMAEIIWNDEELQYLADYEYEPMELGIWCSVIGNVFDNPELLIANNKSTEAIEQDVELER